MTAFASAAAPARAKLLRRLADWRLILPLALAGAALAALSLGKFEMSPAEIPQMLCARIGLCAMAPQRMAALANVVIDLRLPRVAAAILVGAALASSGAAFQAVFRNPLASPSLLGVLAGASFGAALGIVLGLPWPAVQALAFAMGLAAVAFGASVAALFRGAPVVMLVLGGMISHALFSALLSLVKFVADPVNQLPNIVYWLMGNLGQSDLAQVMTLAPVLLAGVVLLCALGRGLDLLAMGDDEARSLGVPASALRLGAIALATLISALTVSLAGMIGWVGLIAPHVARLALGAGNSRLIPASAMLGAIFLLGADALARTLADVEIPIGIVTELLGLPVFMAVLGRVRRGWNA
jgi:iron complex transport system permease protein